MTACKGGRQQPLRAPSGTAPAAKGNPNNPWNRAILGGALYLNGKHKEPIAELTAALQLPDDMGAHLCAKHFLALTTMPSEKRIRRTIGDSKPSSPSTPPGRCRSSIAFCAAKWRPQ